MRPLIVSLLAFGVLASFGNLTLAQRPDVAETGKARPQGFMHIPFGSSQETVMQRLPYRMQAHVDHLSSRKDYLWLDGGTFADFRAKYVIAEFMNDRLWNISVTLEPQSKDHSKEFAAFRQMLTQKYGPGTAEQAGERQIARWSFTGAEGGPETIRIDSQPFGHGLIVWYLRESVRTRGLATTAPDGSEPAFMLRSAALNDL